MGVNGLVKDVLTGVPFITLQEAIARAGGNRVGIDASVVLHRSKAKIAHDLVAHGGKLNASMTESYIGFIQRTLEAGMRAGATFLIVFDGNRLPMVCCIFPYTRTNNIRRVHSVSALETSGRVRAQRESC